MSKNYICPYCEVMFVSNHETSSSTTTAFGSRDLSNYLKNKELSDLNERVQESAIELSYYYCPNCHHYSVEIFGLGDNVSDIDYRILPFGKAKEFPEYVPEVIRKDYEEACLIKDLSPKSSATLSRRCLQGMIRDFWKIEQSNLNRAINELEGKIPADQWKVIHATRQMGNIAAHMETDINKIINIDPMEAERLIQLIEFLIGQWYVNQHEVESLFSDINKMNSEKQKQRK